MKSFQTIDMIFPEDNNQSNVTDKLSFNHQLVKGEDPVKQRKDEVENKCLNSNFKLRANRKEFSKLHLKEKESTSETLRKVFTASRIASNLIQTKQ